MASRAARPTASPVAKVGRPAEQAAKRTDVSIRNPRGHIARAGFFLPLSMTLAAKPFAAAVNHLLARESWARERLAPYAGKTARLVLSAVSSLTLLVQPDGYLAAVDETEAHQFDVTISVPARRAAGLRPRRSGGRDEAREDRRRRGVRDGHREARRASALGAGGRSRARDRRRSGAGEWRRCRAHGRRTCAPHGPQSARLGRRIPAR